MLVRNEVISTRFTTKHTEQLKKIADEQNISVSKLVENMSVHYLDVLSKCFKRQDMMIQRDEMKELYNNFSKDQLDSWIDKKYPKTVSCMKLFVPIMKLFVPIMKFNEISDVWLDWFKMNNHYLFYEDNDGWRNWQCNSEMGYNWLYVNGKIYSKMFESIGCHVKNFSATKDRFSFMVNISN